MQDFNEDDVLITAIKGDSKSVNEAAAWILNDSGWREKYIIPFRKYEDVFPVETAFEDAFHEGIAAFVQAIRRDEFKSKSNLKTYLEAFCRNKFLTALTKAKKHKQRFVNMETEQIVFQEVINMDELQKRERNVEAQELLKMLLSQLSERCQFILAYKKEGYSIAEIATLLDKKPQTIKNDAFDCRTKLKELGKGNAFLRAKIELFL